MSSTKLYSFHAHTQITLKCTSLFNKIPRDWCRRDEKRLGQPVGAWLGVLWVAANKWQVAKTFFAASLVQSSYAVATTYNDGIFYSLYTNKSETKQVRK